LGNPHRRQELNSVVSNDSERRRLRDTYVLPLQMREAYLYHHHDSKNQIIRRLSERDYNALSPSLTHAELKTKQVLLTVGQPIGTVYFVESGMVSLIAEIPGLDAIEVGLIGNEGLTDQVLEPGDTALLKCVVQMAGTALAVAAADYVNWISDRPKALKTVLRYQQALTLQTSFTALANGSFTIEQRLARWLLMSFDRSGGQEIPLVHDFISMMLAVRRSGVTTAMHVLEGEGAIRNIRGQIQLRDREVLEHLAHGSYGVPEREYARLLGPLPT
jgi:CRP-like cAMP-binding protein